MNVRPGSPTSNPGARVIVADPPWTFGDKLPGNGRGAEKHYRLLSQADIEGFLPKLISEEGAAVADNAVLFLWRVASQVEEAYRVVRAWGFVPKTEIVWQKLTTTGKQHFGMGRIVRASHEVCIVARRGRLEPKVRNIRSTFEAQVGRHSEKPEAFFDLVEQLYDGPYLELFARRQRSGWTCMGDEAPAAADLVACDSCGQPMLATAASCVCGAVYDALESGAA